MSTASRRSFLGAAGLAAASSVAGSGAATAGAGVTATVPLNGEWEFRIEGGAWKTVRVPHTWQVDAATSGYLGRAVYRRRFHVPADWAGSALRLEFESVFHSARVRVNGRAAGEHTGKGYTGFTLDITDLAVPGKPNELEVEVDNAFSDAMLPRNNSYDWTPDGGIYRPVWLHATPPVFIERVEVDATPDLAAGTAAVTIRAVVRNRSGAARRVAVEAEVLDDASGLPCARAAGSAEIPAGAAATVALPAAAIDRVRLWHFDHPNLYRACVKAGAHAVEETFGVRRIEVRAGALYLNGERVRLMGVERMAGSHPQFGMAEPLEWIEHDHRDMKELNCVFTRVHWMQDRRLLDWCDRNGMLMQLEVPTWGGATWKGMKDEPSATILSNGLEQLREMIAQNRNHPSIFAWGLCNEIGGADPPAKKFAQSLFREARKLDPGRLLSYASNTLHSDPAGDVAGEMDILEWNEYFESWFGGTPESVRAALAKIRSVYPDKMIVISEYGLCECSPTNPTSDARRIEVLRAHNAVFREEPNVGGLIFFCYNDYRTHIGDKGQGVLKQRVHGVVDVYGAPKPSWEVLRRESSPVESLSVTKSGDNFAASLRTRATVPAYPLLGYRLRWTVYAFGDLPMEQVETELPELRPGVSHNAAAAFKEKDIRHVVVEIVRPTGSTVLRETWTA
jgi:beta-galactosidase